jgi:hypothetical protein
MSLYVLQAVIFDEIDLSDLSFAECSIKNVNHCFQVRPVLRNASYPSIPIRLVVELTLLWLYELVISLLSVGKSGNHHPVYLTDFNEIIVSLIPFRHVLHDFLIFYNGQ